VWNQHSASALAFAPSEVKCCHHIRLILAKITVFQSIIIIITTVLSPVFNAQMYDTLPSLYNLRHHGMTEAGLHTIFCAVANELMCFCVEASDAASTRLTCRNSISCWRTGTMNCSTKLRTIQTIHSISFFHHSLWHPTSDIVHTIDNYQHINEDTGVRLCQQSNWLLQQYPYWCQWSAATEAAICPECSCTDCSCTSGHWSQEIRAHEWVSEWVSSCLTAHQHNIGHSVPWVIKNV